MRTYSQIGNEGTGRPLCGRFGWTLACGSGSRCWGREEEPHSPSLSGQFPKSRHLICLGSPGCRTARGREAQRLCSTSLPDQPTSQLCPGLKATVAQGSRVKKGRSPTQMQTQQLDCGMQCRSDPRTGRHCLENQTADSGILESAEAGSHRLSGYCTE